MSPALVKKYLEAARDVADHLVLKPDGFAFAPHPVVADTDRDKYCVNRIIDFYKRQPTDYADYFLAAWRFQHRAALGKPTATLADVAARGQGQPEVPGDGLGDADGAAEDVGPLAAAPGDVARAARRRDRRASRRERMRDSWSGCAKSDCDARPRRPGSAAPRSRSEVARTCQYATHRTTTARSRSCSWKNRQLAAEPDGATAGDGVDDGSAPAHAAEARAAEP